MRILAILALVFCLLAPLMARGQGKDPMDYPLKQYGFLLGTALLGGLVSWSAKVRKGEVQAWQLTHLVGELCTSAFAGLLAFWLCEWASTPALLTASFVGIAGHMGARAIQTFEAFAQRRWGSDMQVQPPTLKDPPP